MKLELITWYDHWGRVGGGWTPLDQIDEPEPSVMKSIGWVVKENKHGVLLSPDIDTGQGDGSIKSNGEQFILKSCIKSRKKVKQ